MLKTRNHTINIIIIDDDDRFVKGLRLLFDQADINILFTANNFGALITQLSDKRRPDVLLLDIDLNGVTSLDHLEKLKKLLPKTKILVITGLDIGPALQHSLRRGVDGFLNKGAAPSHFLNAVREIYNGNAYLDPETTKHAMRSLNAHPTFKKRFGLTEIEYEIVLHLLDGLSYKIIGDTMGITLDSARYHIKSIYKKAKVNGKVELIKKIHS